jgi:ABC-type multidrug transport system fused ATPase/permease subunit
MKNIFFLFFTLNYRIKISLFFLLLFSVLSYFIEFLGIGLIPVFFYYLINPEHTTVLIKNFPGIDTENFIFLNYLDPKFFVLLIFFIFFFKNLFIFFLVYFENKVINNFAIYNAKRFFSYYINQRYIVHLSQDINKITRNIIIENESLKNSLLSSLGIIKEFVVIFFLVLILFFVNTLVTTYLVLFFSIVIFIYHYIFNKRLSYIGKSALNARSVTYKYTLQTFSLFREINLFGGKKFFLKNFLNKINSLYKNYIYLNIVSRISKSVIELSLVFTIAIVLFIFGSLDTQKSDVFLTTSIYLVYSIRLLPSFNSLSFLWSRLAFYSASAKLFLSEYKNLEKNLILEKNRRYLKKFNTFIKFKNISFCYPNQKKNVLENSTFNIKSGGVYGIFGRSGSGKTTLINLITGLLKPSSGKIIIDGKNIKDNFQFNNNFFSYISQDVTLLDDTIKNNIIFNTNKTNIKILNKICKFAELDNFVKNLKNGLDTFLLDGGKNLSGGQKQRICIARALYQNSNIIIMDEPTSALDNLSALNIIKNIKTLYKNKTIIIISHKLDLLKNCNEIFFLKNKKVISFNSYKKLKINES